MGLAQCPRCGQRAMLGRSQHNGPCADNQAMTIGASWVNAWQDQGWVRAGSTGAATCRYLPSTLAQRYWSDGPAVFAAAGQGTVRHMLAVTPCSLAMALPGPWYDDEYGLDPAAVVYRHQVWWTRPWCMMLVDAPGVPISVRLDLIDEWAAVGGLPQETQDAWAAAQLLGARPGTQLALIGDRCGAKPDAGKPCHLRLGHTGYHHNHQHAWQLPSERLVRWDRNSLAARTWCDEEPTNEQDDD